MIDWPSLLIGLFSGLAGGAIGMAIFLSAEMQAKEGK